MILNGHQQGQGEPAILIHGLFGSLSNLGLLGKALSEHFNVHMVDVRNHGGSPQNEHMDYASMAEDVVRYMEAQNIPRTHFVGHSMGGKIAMQIAMNYAERVNRLVVADIAPVTYENWHDSVIEGLTAIDLKKIKSRRDAEHVLAGHVNEPDIRSFLLKNLVKAPTGDHMWRLNLDGIRRSYPNIALAPEGKPFNGPSLFIKGSESGYIQTKHRGAVLKCFPKAELKVIEGAGHWLHAQKPGLFNRVVLTYLKK